MGVRAIEQLDFERAEGPVYELVPVRLSLDTEFDLDILTPKLERLIHHSGRKQCRSTRNPLKPRQQID
jgi:hypothetical protein